MENECQSGVRVSPSAMWVIGVVFTLVSGVAGIYIGRESIAGTVQKNSERLSVLETQYIATKQALDEIKTGQKQIYELVIRLGDGKK